MGGNGSGAAFLYLGELCGSVELGLGLLLRVGANPLEPVDAETSRLVGTTSNPMWYVEQLAAIPASYRIVRCPELQEAARVLGKRLLAASET